MEIPAAFRDDRGAELFVMDKNVAVFSFEQAYLVLQYNIPGLKVWGMRPPLTHLLPSAMAAKTFFGESELWLAIKAAKKARRNRLDPALIAHLDARVSDEAAKVNDALGKHGREMIDAVQKISAKHRPKAVRNKDGTWKLK